MVQEEKDIRKSVCQACKQIRIKSGLTVAEFAYKYNLDRQDVHLFERTNAFKFRIFSAYHDAFGITLEQFCEVENYDYLH